MVLNVFDLHNSSKVWNNPRVFNPERFAPRGEAEKGSGLQWVPFSNGSRQCIGMNFSMTEQKVLLPMLCMYNYIFQSIWYADTHLVRKFEWKLPEDSIHKESLITEGLILSNPKDLKITFNRRY